MDIGLDLLLLLVDAGYHKDKRDPRYAARLRTNALGDDQAHPTLFPLDSLARCVGYFTPIHGCGLSAGGASPGGSP